MSTILNKSGLQYSYKIDPGGSANVKTLESNQTSINLITPKLDMVKSVDKTYATIGDTLNYTVTLTNSGNILLSNISFKDILPAGAKFITGSVKVDNISQPTYDIITGFDLGSMILLATKTVTFSATVESLPTPNTIINKATTTYNYLVTSLVSGSAQSNSVTTTINVSNVSVVKASNVADVEQGNEITYTITITNNGNINATNITFSDTLDIKTSFVTGSVTVNGETKAEFNPNTGFALADLIPGATTTITFKATVL